MSAIINCDDEIADCPVEWAIDDGQLMITLMANFALKSLLEQINDNNLHDETSTGVPVGNEAG